MKRLISMSIFCMILVAGFLPSEARAAAAGSGPVNVRSAPVPSSIKIIAPKAGDQFNIGSIQTINWSYSALTGTVRLLLYKGGLPTATTPVIVSLTLDGTGNGTFKWSIHPDLAPGNDYTIAVQSNDKPGVKGVSAPFSLISKDFKVFTPNTQDMPLLISITQPTPNTAWQVGTTHTITWQTPNNASGDVNIMLLKGDTIVQNIANNIPVKNGNFSFTIANSITGNLPNDPQFRIDIVGAANPKLRGTSDFFSIVMPPFNLSGSVKTAGNLAMSGVTMTLGGDVGGNNSSLTLIAKSITTTTDSSGSYSFIALTSGSYTITPSKDSCSFTPPSMTVLGNGVNVTGKNFTGKCGNNISGKVTAGVVGIGLPGVTMSLILNGQKIATTTTDPSGNYSFSGLINGYYTLDVSKQAYMFNDSPKKVTVNGADVTVDFTVNNQFQKVY
jgi:hypothetical protein